MRILMFLLLFCGGVQAAELDANLMVISDLRHSQVNDEVIANLQPLINVFQQDAPDVTNWLGMGDIINQSSGQYGPFSANASDLTTAFASGGITFKSLADSHDTGGSNWTEVRASGLYPADQWAWDIGEKWRVLAIEVLHVFPGYIISAAQIAWLQDQLAAAVTDGRYLIVAVHVEMWRDMTWPYASALTPSATTGAIQITSDTASTFVAGDVGKIIALRSESCPTGVESCWGYGAITALNSGTSVNVTVTGAFSSTDATTKWNWEQALYQVPLSNGDYIRTLFEAAGNSVVKLVLNGHLHENGFRTVNGIDYLEMASATTTYISAGNGVKTGGLLYLNTDGTWGIAGTGKQISYNWNDFYVSTLGSSANGGTLANDPWDMSTMLSRVDIGDTVNFLSNIVDDITLNGSSGNMITLKSYLSRIEFSGNIAGSYLNCENIDIEQLHIISASNSTFKQLRSTR